MSDPFDAPSNGAKITEFEERLLLLTPLSVERDISTTYGPADATLAEVVVLDGPEAGRKESGMRIFQKALQGQLRAKVGTGRMVLGRLGKGTAKTGQSAPWLLAEPTEQDKKLAREHLAKQGSPPF